MSFIDFTGGAAANDALRDKLNSLKKLPGSATRFQYPETYEREWDGLLPFKWGGISFPVNNVTFKLAHKQVTHQFPHMNDAFLETMGRDPLDITADCIFFNTISPAANEEWQEGLLYPVVYTTFLQMMADGNTVRDLQHPFLGVLRCKPIDLASVLDGSTRDGDILKCTWRTTLEQDGDKSDLSNETKIQAATKSAQEADSFRPFPSELNISTGPSFMDFMNAIQGLFDTVNLFRNQVTSSFNAPIGAANRILASINRLNDPGYSTLENIIKKHKANLLELQANTFDDLGFNQNREVKIFVTNEEMTLTQVAIIPAIAATSGMLDVIRLNPEFLGKPTIPIGSQVKYYG